MIDNPPLLFLRGASLVYNLISWVPPIHHGTSYCTARLKREKMWDPAAIPSNYVLLSVWGKVGADKNGGDGGVPTVVDTAEGP